METRGRAQQEDAGRVVPTRWGNHLNGNLVLFDGSLGVAVPSPLAGEIIRMETWLKVPQTWGIWGAARVTLATF